MMRRRHWWLIWVGILVLPFLMWGVYRVGSYMLASYEYEKLVATKPTTRSEVDGLVFLCSVKKVDITNSLWGKDIAIAPEDECWQYNILWNDPIDIIYDSQGKVKYIFPSFE